MSIVVLGYRAGMAEALARRGQPTYYLVEKVKPGLPEPFRVVRDLEDGQEVLRALMTGAVPVSGVVTGHEQGVFTAALVRSALDVPVGSRDVAATLRFRDKYLQKRALSGVVPTARCERLTREADFGDLAARLGAPFVVKPSNGHGSHRTAVVGTAAALRGYLREAGEHGDDQFVAESFVDGEEFHVDGLWDGTRVTWSNTGVYLAPPISAYSGTPLSEMLIGTAGESEYAAAAEKLADTVLSTLGAAPTVFHLEGFRRPGTGELVFGECALRLPGGRVPECTRHAYGIDLYEAAVAFALGETPPVPDPAATGIPTGYVLLRQDRTGERGADYYREHYDVVDLAMRAEPSPGVPYEQVGYAILTHPDRDELRRRLTAMVRENAESSHVS
ncbi:acetyl-CoA carboxylase biotin carboxylase subunit family protein [Actinoplanes sp. L3-i22]|uniref:ATP-grasp domain-containing protein n=1 Tax=Actinoplanes sp. L3-i22 TaxID=2836373 RepID=UPI001C780D8C|nr:hypothetical protein [Actinoplanes sp. L3-i22]BCY13351.1 hypothetical protein L3i22_084390 [Actinoplanes sp. L3-i22]